MCGIAGIVDLAGQRVVAPGVVRRMADAILHRGPDDDGYLEQPGFALANRRLSIVGLKDGKQPITNEDGSVAVVFNGEFFDYPEVKASLEAKGHTFRTSTDTEIIPHLYEEYGDDLFAHLKGQFSFCLWDRRRNRLLLARDRMGICPLFYTTQVAKRGPDAGTRYFLFASEIKALLASGHVDARVDMNGVNQVFSFLALPGPVTCFEGVSMLPAGGFLSVQLGDGEVKRGQFWHIDFPDQGQEEDPPQDRLVEDFEKLFVAAVERRLRADVPVVSYLSGGVDSSVVVAVASKVLGRPIPTFTISVKAKGLDEAQLAARTARDLGSEGVVVDYADADVCGQYPELIRAAESPVVDTSCAALMMLAKSVRGRGFKVALTGEGADETLAGYPWFKYHKLLSSLNVFGLPVSDTLRRLALKVSGQPTFSKAAVRASQDSLGGHNGWMDLYGLMSLSKLRFFRDDYRRQFAEANVYDTIELSPRLQKWHPFNRALYVGQRIMLAGSLLSTKGDRVAMNSSVETRYPFLDESVVAFLAKLHPRWKLRGLTEKYLLRLMASRWLPKETAWRTKAMFRAPFDSFHVNGPGVPPWVHQVLSSESLAKTGMFDAGAVERYRAQLPTLRRTFKRTSIELGLVAVTATQLWHHLYISGDLADLPSMAGDLRAGAAA